VQLAQHREDREHLRRRGRIRAPVAPAVRALGDVLPGSEAVEHRATFEAARSQLGMDAAAEVRGQIRARLAHVLVDGEVG